jgi:simple sugar transport system ATP-binding protein
MEKIGKSFPGVRALQQVDFEVRAGEVHALVGANGAGKSTLMKVLSGAYHSDEGAIYLSGSPVQLREPSDAIEAGIHCVYQEVDAALVPAAGLTENVFLDRLAHSSGWINWSRLDAEAKQLLASVGLETPVHRHADRLTISEKQLVLLARAVAGRMKLLILDEPTAPLGPEETKRLFALVRKIKDSGVGVVFISHRLSEVFELCDRITIMRDGQRIDTKQAEQTNAKEIVQLMLGRAGSHEYVREKRQTGQPLLEAKGLRSSTKVKDVSFTLHSGEIVAVVGLVGAGKTELSRLLFGADPLDAGSVHVHGHPVRLREPADAIAAGIALIPEERRKQGLLIDESIAENLALPSLRSLRTFGLISKRKMLELADRTIKRLEIRPPDPSKAARLLSGGNQQKIVVGKWAETNADIYLFDEPTKGVDIGAKQDMLRLADELAGRGKAVLYLTGELSEAIAIADRILVMSYGEIVKELAASEATTESLLYYASGGDA